MSPLVAALIGFLLALFTVALAWLVIKARQKHELTKEESAGTFDKSAASHWNQ